MNDRQTFIRELAKFLVEGAASKSIKMQIGDASARQWSELRATTPLLGYPTLDEAEAILTQFLETPSSSWIPVSVESIMAKNGEPEDEQEVLFLDESFNIRIGSINRCSIPCPSIQWNDHNDDDWIGPATYWMPIPDKPGRNTKG